MVLFIQIQNKYVIDHQWTHFHLCNEMKKTDASIQSMIGSTPSIILISAWDLHVDSLANVERKTSLSLEIKVRYFIVSFRKWKMWQILSKNAYQEPIKSKIVWLLFLIDEQLFLHFRCVIFLLRLLLTSFEIWRKMEHVWIFSSFLFRLTTMNETAIITPTSKHTATVRDDDDLSFTSWTFSFV